MSGGAGHTVAMVGPRDEALFIEALFIRLRALDDIADIIAEVRKCSGRPEMANCRSELEAVGASDTLLAAYVKIDAVLSTIHGGGRRLAHAVVDLSTLSRTGSWVARPPVADDPRIAHELARLIDSGRLTSAHLETPSIPERTVVEFMSDSVRNMIRDADALPDREMRKTVGQYLAENLLGEDYRSLLELLVALPGAVPYRFARWRLPHCSPQQVMTELEAIMSITGVAAITERGLADGLARSLLVRYTHYQGPTSPGETISQMINQVCKSLDNARSRNHLSPSRQAATLRELHRPQRISLRQFFGG